MKRLFKIGEQWLGISIIANNFSTIIRSGISQWTPDKQFWNVARFMEPTIPTIASLSKTIRFLGFGSDFSTPQILDAKRKMCVVPVTRPTLSFCRTKFRPSDLIFLLTVKFVNGFYRITKQGSIEVALKTSNMGLLPRWMGKFLFVKTGNWAYIQGLPFSACPPLTEYRLQK